jgi:hypothetical protein
VVILMSIWGLARPQPYIQKQVEARILHQRARDKAQQPWQLRQASFGPNHYVFFIFCSSCQREGILRSSSFC